MDGWNIPINWWVDGSMIGLMDKQNGEGLNILKWLWGNVVRRIYNDWLKLEADCLIQLIKIVYFPSTFHLKTHCKSLQIVERLAVYALHPHRGPDIYSFSSILFVGVGSCLCTLISLLAALIHSTCHNVCVMNVKQGCITVVSMINHILHLHNKPDLRWLASWT